MNLDMGDIGELTPTVAALAALADGPSELTGIAHLRGHETNRLAALVTEINRLGGNAEELEDGIRITPAPLTGGDWMSYEDHRMATAGAIIGLKVPGTRVENIGTTGKTMPDFDIRWSEMLGLTMTTRTTRRSNPEPIPPMGRVRRPGPPGPRLPSPHQGPPEAPGRQMGPRDHQGPRPLGRRPRRG